MRTALKTLLTLVLVAMLAIPALAAATITPVVKTHADEWGPASGSGGITWNRYTKTDAWVNADTGGGVFRVNPSTTSAWNGSIEGNVLTYQQTDRRRLRSDIFRYDIVAKDRQATPSYVNTKWWEYWPTQSGPWILFARTNVGYGQKREWRQILLVDTVTGEKRVLAKGPESSNFWPAQVNGLWAVWGDCPRAACVVYLYDITGDVKTKIPQSAFHQYSPAVSADGTMYYVRSGRACGKNVSIIRRAPDGTESTLYSFPDGTDAGDLYVDDDATQDLYFEDMDCANNWATDIYKITGADTASPVIDVIAGAPDGEGGELVGHGQLTRQQRAAARMTP